MDEKKVYKLVEGDCLEIMEGMPDNSVDAVVTDPPYNIGFMGKKWDVSGIAYTVKLWRDVLRVLKPGGHMLVFGGARTYHRMACAVEDGGFEIRDQLMWVYGSGFPKSFNLGKAVDKLQENNRVDLGYNENSRINKPDKNIYKAGIRDNGARLTKGVSHWVGWGTALKPAHEPLVLARKPISEKTIAKNVLKWGTGGLNIDGCRIPLKGEDPPSGSAKRIFKSNQYTLTGIYGNNKQTPLSGRFPANLIHDGSDEVVTLFPDSKGQQGDLVNHNKRRKSPHGCYGEFPPANDHLKRNDSGSAARFFYCAKASKSERNKGLEVFRNRLYGQSGTPTEGNTEHKQNYIELNGGNVKNHHPTVKPINLMRYLCRLVTPNRGTVFDPFMGSGTTGIAAKLEGFGFIGIEEDKEYFRIAKDRIDYWSKTNLRTRGVSIIKKEADDGRR